MSGQIFIGDEGVVRVKVKDVKGDHVLADSLNAPFREFWFPASYFERTTQGAASVDNDKKAAAGAGAPGLEPATVGAAAAVAVDEALSLKEQAIAHVMSKGYDRVAAEKIVEDVGTRTIIADRDDELKEAAQEKAAEPSPGQGSQNQASTAS